MIRERRALTRGPRPALLLPAVLVLAAALLALPSDRAAAAGSFWDDDGGTHEHQIEALVAAGVTRGCDPPLRSRFCPDDEVSRGEMASFLARALGLPAASEDRFADDDGSVHEDAVDRLAAAGITDGCNPPENDRFCPERPVRRGEMAAFLDRAFPTPQTAEDAFLDDDGTLFEPSIDRIAAARITLGCDPARPERFCPGETVRRGQMASFLVRADDDVRALDPERLHERRVTYDVRALEDAIDDDLVALLARRAEEVLYAERSWNVRHRLLLAQVAPGEGDFTLWLTQAEDVGSRAPGCSDAYSCTVGDDIYINLANFLDRPDTWRGRTQADYQRYLVLHETGHWLDFDDTADPDEPSHYNDDRFCFDQDGDGAPEAPVMRQQTIALGGCTTSLFPLPFERDCVEEAWLADTTDQGDGDADIDDQCPHEPTQR